VNPYLKKTAARIRSLAGRYREETAGCLSEIVKIPSLSGGEQQVIDRIAQMLKERGFDEVRTDGLGNLIARIGEGDKALAVDAHIDTVDTGDRSQWEFDPFCGEIRGGWVLGRGTVDQKGGAASMITAGRILKDLGYGGNLAVHFTFTVEEEDYDGYCWNYLIEEENLRPDFAVITEPTSCAVYRGHRGRMELELTLRGISSHGSAPERGENAIYKASRIALKIEQLNSRLQGEELLGKGSVTVTQVTSESPSLCAVPDRCKLHLDRRLAWGETRESVLEELEQIFKAESLDDDAQVTIPRREDTSYRGTPISLEMYFPTWKLPEDHPLVQAGVKTYTSLYHKRPKTGRWMFSTNAVAICGEHGIPTIGFGPGDETYAHAPNERIQTDHLERAAAFYALLPYVLMENPK
jgi:putative selenium metabolism hydrolase